jgi:hypothetical protein
MPLLFAYLLAIGLFIGGGYGTLAWLTQTDPPPRRPIVAGGAPTPHAPTPVPARSRAAAAAVPTPAADGPEVTSSSGPSAGSKIAAPSDDRRADPGQPAPSADNVAQRAAMPVSEAAPAGPAPPLSPASLPSLDPSLPAADGSGAAQAMASPAAGADAAVPVPARHRRAARRAEPRRTVAGQGRSPYRAMILRTVEWPDGSRQSFLVPMDGRRMIAADQD